MSCDNVTWRKAFLATAGVILAISFYVIFGIVRAEDQESRDQGQKYQDMIRSVYERVNPPEARDGIFRLMELLSSESYRQADVDVQSSATATLEEFLLQFGSALEQAKQTGKTGYLGLLRARMRNDKDMVILYLRDLGLLQDGTSKGD